MDALMIYHHALCKETARRRDNSISPRAGRAMSVFENSLRRMPKMILAQFGAGKREPANRPRSGER